MIKVTGSLRATVMNKATGSIVARRTIKNLIMPAGEVYVANRLSYNNDITPISKMKIGNGTLAPTDTDTSLELLLADADLLGEVTQGAGVDANTVTILAVIDAGIEYVNITEAGLFYGPTMFSRVVFDPMNKTADESMSLLWTITISGE